MYVSQAEQSFLQGGSCWRDYFIAHDNLLLFRTMYKLLRCTCLHCFHLKMPQKEVERYQRRLHLLLEGRLIEAAEMSSGSSSMSKQLQGLGADINEGLEGSVGPEDDSSDYSGKGTDSAAGLPREGRRPKAASCACHGCCVAGG